MKQMKTIGVGLLTVIALVVGVSAAPSVAGKWDVSVSAPQGVMTAVLTLTQDGKKVSGTFVSDHGTFAFDGEFVDGTLTVSAMVDHGNGPEKMTLIGASTDGKTLAGKLSSPMGDMAWTAERAKAK